VSEVTEFAGHAIEFPFGPAAGVLNGSNEELLRKQTIGVLRSPAGLAWIGSVTWNGGVGNEPEHGVVYYYNAATRQAFNSMGLPNIGARRAAVLYRELKAVADDNGKPLIPSVSPGRGEDPMQVLPDMAELFAEAGAAAIEVNYSCPNKIDETGAREPMLGNDLEAMQAVDNEVVQRAGTDILIIRKLPPYLDERRALLPRTARMFQQAAGRVAVNLSNTIGGQVGLTERGDRALKVPGGEGGMSGPATASIGIDQLTEFRRHLDPVAKTVDIVSCLGIMTGDDAFERVHTLRADIASGVTVFLENEARGKSYGQTCLEIAEQYAVRLEQAA
jgi:dihydroorotate dehydrogenase